MPFPRDPNAPGGPERSAYLSANHAAGEVSVRIATLGVWPAVIAERDLAVDQPDRRERLEARLIRSLVGG